MANYYFFHHAKKKENYYKTHVDLSWQPYPIAVSGSIHTIQNFRCMIFPWLPSFLYNIFFVFRRFHVGVGIHVQSRQAKSQTEYFWSLWLLYGIQEIPNGIQENLYGIQVLLLFGIQEFLFGNQKSCMAYTKPSMVSRKAFEPTIKARKL